MRTFNKQHGWTVWGMLMVMTLVVFFGLLIMRLTPPYLDNLKIKKALNTVATEAKTVRGGRAKMIERMNRLLYVDYAHDVVDIRKTLKIEKARSKTILRFDYEVVVPLAYNISALLEFENSAEVRRP